MDDEKLLLADYEHFTEALFKNEETGERRIEFFIAIVSAVVGGVVLLFTTKDLDIPHPVLRQLATGALVAMLVLGVVTLGRILQRDRVTEEYKKILSYLRRELKRRSPGLAEYELPLRQRARWLVRGGLGVTAATMNSLIVAGIAAIWVEGPGRWVAAMAGFVAAFWLQSLLIQQGQRGPALGSQVYRAGAGAVILNRRGQVLALKRRDVPGAWQLPQGGLEHGEQPLDAALREVREETGLPSDRLRRVTRNPILLAYELPAEYRSAKTGRGQVHHWFIFRYDGPDELITLGDGKEFEDWRWTSMDEVVDNAVAFKRPVYRRLRKAWARVSPSL